MSLFTTLKEGFYFEAEILAVQKTIAHHIVYRIITLLKNLVLLATLLKSIFSCVKIFPNIYDYCVLFESLPNFRTYHNDSSWGACGLIFKTFFL